uniref:CSON004819 protein n=1 Tax=Culicoides sonorensis TaxID=179676 RepID=A0A336MU22_CULSO
MKFILLIFLLEIYFISTVFTADKENFLQDDTTMSGIMFPEKLVAIEGSDINLKLVNPFNATQICSYRTPKSIKNEEIGTQARIIKWDTEICGIIVKSVTKSDEGIWRLASKRDNDFIRGVLMVTIEPKSEVVMDDESEILNYCVVTRPNSIGFPQIGKCHIPEDLPGEWTISKGIQGQNKEIIEEVYHEPKVETLTTKVEKERTGSIHLLCTLKNSNRMVKACRFLRVSDNKGFNMDDGLGSDYYRFYGKGLEDNECGISITKPGVQDKGLWKCFISTVTQDGKSQEKSFGSALDAGDVPTNLRITFPGRQALISGQKSNITCNANLPISYCWFRKPNGQIISVSDQIDMTHDEDEENSKSFSYHGLSFGLGDCGIELKEVKPEDAGQWRCSVGTAKAGFEAQQIFQVDVRQTDPLIVAEMPQITVNTGDSFKIECHTVTSHMPLEQCHFVTPTGTGFSIDESVTSENSLGAYYFNPNRKMRSGWCSLIVKRARKEHAGTWQCMAKAHTWKTEGIDTMVVQVRVTFPGRQALISGQKSNITCNANLPISYCWFRKPNGQIISVSDQIDMTHDNNEDDSKSYSYHGLSFGLGDCGIELKEVKPEDAGQWRCSVGTAKAGFEAQQIFQVDVRQTDPLIVAEMPQITVNTGDSFKIECYTVTSYMPLEQCHFVTPTGTGFSIDESVTSENSLGAYYFNPNRKMRSGWCSLVVKRARKEHAGTWQCMAKAHTWKTEGIDTMVVQVRAGIAIANVIGGIVIALIFVATVTILTVYVMQKRKRARILQQAHELNEERRASQLSSTSSNTSGDFQVHQNQNSA